MAESQYELGFGISNAFGYRSAGGDAKANRAEAQAVANSVVSTVTTKLDTFANTGEVALQDAKSAIEALGQFKPTTLSVSYSPPVYSSTTASTPADPASSTNLSGAITAPTTGTVSTSTSDMTLPTNGGSAPVVGSAETYAAPTLQTLTVPTAPTSMAIPDVPDAPSTSSIVSPQFYSLVEPSLISLEIPTLEEFVLPTLNAPAAATAPNVIQPTYANVGSYNPKRRGVSLSTDEVVDVAVIGNDLDKREVRASVEVFRTRGIVMEEPVINSQIQQAGDYAKMVNAVESRRAGIDSAVYTRDASREAAQLQMELDVNLVESKLSAARLLLEYEANKVESRIQLANAIVTIYNARIAEFNYNVELYKAQLTAKLAPLEKWKAQIQAEIAKARVNTQLGQNYATKVQTLSVQVDKYNAQVQAMYGDVQRYKAEMQAFQTKGDVAKAKIGVFVANIGVYSANLETYKFTFDKYAASVRSVIAENQYREAKVKLDSAKVLASSAELDKAAAAIQVEADKKKLEIIVKQSEYESTRIKNLVESVVAQIDTEKGKIDIQKWAQKQQLKVIPYEAQAVDAQASTRFYGNVASTTYRVAEQTMRALTSAITSSAMAQDSAAKAAASVAQGAYSAIHVSASLHGSGSVSGAEEVSDRVQNYYSDMLNYSREKIASISA